MTPIVAAAAAAKVPVVGASVRITDDHASRNSKSQLSDATARSRTANDTGVFAVIAIPFAPSAERTVQETRFRSHALHVVHPHRPLSRAVARVRLESRCAASMYPS